MVTEIGDQMPFGASCQRSARSLEIKPMIRTIITPHLWQHIHADLVENIDIPVAEQLGNQVYMQTEEPI
jgi:integrase